jgi:hypothetical protein
MLLHNEINYHKTYANYPYLIITQGIHVLQLNIVLLKFVKLLSID